VNLAVKPQRLNFITHWIKDLHPLWDVLKATNTTTAVNSGVVAIPGCQLDCIWDELQSRIGRLSSDPNLEAGR
jgi:RNAse (barnase) inhibitor barstar